MMALLLMVVYGKIQVIRISCIEVEVGSVVR